MQTIQMESSFTFVAASMLKEAAGSVIDSKTFGSPDEHNILRDDALADDLRAFAMANLPLARIKVGSREHNSAVEFFVLDAKKNKKELLVLKKLIGRRWLDLSYQLELTRYAANGDLFSDEVTEPIGAIENLIELRRFISNGTSSTLLTKQKRNILAFHHSASNAPQPE